MRDNPKLIIGAKDYYKDKPIDFINHWCITYDPRNAISGRPCIMPFILFPKQEEIVFFVVECLENQVSGLIEKCRDMGVTWVCAAISVWLWLFMPGSAVGWGSRKEALVDRLGDPDSIFEKIRMIIDYLPRFMWPAGFDEKSNSNYMKIINPDVASSITGEAGDNIGRGGRSLLYLKDEAQPLGVGILTPSGWKKMGDMKVGSVICGPDGLCRTVTNINDCGEHDVYIVRCTDGTSTKCSINHLWTVNNVFGRRRTLTIPTSEIIKDFKYKSPGGQTKFKYRIPKTKPIVFADGEKLPLHPYIVGVLLGDGSINTGCVTFSSADDEIIANVKERLPDGCVVTRDGESCGYRIVDIERYNKNSRARNAVSSAQIYGERAENKRIPDIYKFASVLDRLECLHGLMDTDGSASGGTCTFHTCSKELADDVRFIVQSLGGAASLNVKPDHRGYRDMHCLHVVLPREFSFFKLSRKNKQVNSRSRQFGKTITSIEKVGREDVRCITVDKKDGLYLTDHCIVTHNSAHYERPEKIEAALGENTNVQIDISSVNGTGNVFYRRRHAGDIWKKGEKKNPNKVQVLILDWRDHPLKNQEWYDNKKERAEAEGLGHLFAQEVDRDYSSSVKGIVIPVKHVKAAIDAHKVLGLKVEGKKIAALDVADDDEEGTGTHDSNALGTRHGILLTSSSEWGFCDTGETARKAVFVCKEKGIKELQYDCIGVGAGVKAETNRLISQNLVPDDFVAIPWNAASSPLNKDEHYLKLDNGRPDKDSPKNSDLFANLKSQGWWQLRLRFKKTYDAVVKKKIVDVDEIISIDSTLDKLHQLVTELSQPTFKHNGAGKIVINKTPEGTVSPNLADKTVMLFWPVEKKIKRVLI